MSGSQTQTPAGNPTNSTPTPASNQQGQPINPERLANMEQATLYLAQICHNNNNHQDDGRNIMRRVAELRPDFFYGSEDPVVLENWIHAFEKALNSTRCPTDRCVEVAVYYFREKADKWWDAKKDGLLNGGGFGWEQLKTALRNRFYPDHIKAKKFNEFLLLKQGEKSLKSYFDQYTELLRFGEELVPTEGKKATRFVEGLENEIRMSMGAGPFRDLEDTYAAAQVMQRAIDEGRDEVKKRKVTAITVPVANNRGSGNNTGDKKPRTELYNLNYSEDQGNQGGGRYYQGPGSPDLTSVRSVLGITQEWTASATR